MKVERRWKVESGREEVSLSWRSTHVPTSLDIYLFFYTQHRSCCFIIRTFLIIYISVVHNIVVTEYEGFFLWLRQSRPKGVATARLVWSAVALRLWRC